MNLPLDRIHDPMNGYGRVLLPLGGGRWLARFEAVKAIPETDRPWGLAGTPQPWTKTRFTVTSSMGYHNCRATGVY
jgi:hypothetical protein